MKKNEDSEKEVQNAIRREPLLNAAGTCANSKFSRHLKKFVYIYPAWQQLDYSSMAVMSAMLQQNQLMLNIPDHHSQTISLSGLMAIGVGTIKRMYMCRGQAIGRDQDKVRHLLQGIGIRLHVDAPGQRVTGRDKVVSRTI